MEELVSDGLTGHTTEPGITAQELEDFAENGFVCIRSAFSERIASECRSLIWNRLNEKHGILESDPMTWPRRQSVGEIYRDSDGLPWSDVFTNRLKVALDDICGNNRYEFPGLGWWTVSFPGYHCNESWDIDGKWHVDGSGYVHYPYSKQVGLTAIMLFSDVSPCVTGGTTVLKGSHKYIVNMLADAGCRGLSGYQIKMLLNDCDEDWEIEELTGRAGDVYLMHPFLVHARSKNCGAFGDSNFVRFVCHPVVSLKENMSFWGKDLSILERSILEAVDTKGDYNPLHYITPELVNEHLTARARVVAQGESYEDERNTSDFKKRKIVTGPLWESTV